MATKRQAGRGKVRTGRRKLKEFQPVSDDGFKPASLQDVRGRTTVTGGNGGADDGQSR